MPYKVGIITLSDKGARGEREDKSGPAIREMLEGWNLAHGGGEGRNIYEIDSEVLLPDDQILLEGVLMGMCDEEGLDLILTTGSTGFSPRDIAPEATYAVATKNAPGIAEYMRAKSFK